MGRDKVTEPTKRQREVLEQVVAFEQAHGWAPTLRELAQAMGFASTNAVREPLLRLERMGYIERAKGGIRTMRVLHV